MLALSDFEYKHLIVITADQYKHLSLRNGNILIKDEDEKVVNQFSCAKIFCLFVIGECTLTTKLIDELLSFKISLVSLGFNLKYKWMIWNSLAGNTILRHKQYTMTSDIMLVLSKHIITNKIHNQRTLLMKIRNKNNELSEQIQKIDQLLKSVACVDNPDSLRWLEGNAARIFFQSYFAELNRYKRLPRTKCDVINVLMDSGYTYLFYFIEANCNLYGFDTYKWVYHTIFYERKSLICDLMEPRRCIIDQKIKNMANLWQINEEDFVFIKWEYQLSYSKSKEYTKHFLEVIVEHKSQIFLYIKEYYKIIIKQEYGQLPTFDINSPSWL